LLQGCSGGGSPGSAGDLGDAAGTDSASSSDLYFDGKLLQTITDTTVIPTDPMDFLLGTRLVTTPALTSEFDEKVTHTRLDW
jgi:hypothetical protein